jgi:hypothetical protein
MISSCFTLYNQKQLLLGDILALPVTFASRRLSAVFLAGLCGKVEGLP